MAFDVLDDELKEDIDDFIDAQLDAIQIAPIRVDDTLSDDALMLLLEKQEIDDGILDGYYSVHFRKYAWWLTTLRRPKDMTADEFQRFKKEALKFVVYNKTFFRWGSKNIPPRRVVDGLPDQATVLHWMYDKDEGRHKHQEATY